jgi:hypothetical protein
MGGRVKGLAPTSIATRPPPGPARGGVAAPVWLVLALTVAIALLAGLALWRAFKRRRP